MAVGEREPDILKVISICRSLGILEFIEALPGGFKTHLWKNGIALSGGKRQRLSIARTLYKDPEIIIMDEATSALDSAPECTFNRLLLTCTTKARQFPDSLPLIHCSECR